MFLPVHFVADQIVDVFQGMIAHAHIAQMRKCVGDIVDIGTGIALRSSNYCGSILGFEDPAY